MSQIIEATRLSLDIIGIKTDTPVEKGMEIHLPDTKLQIIETPQAVKDGVIRIRVRNVAGGRHDGHEFTTMARVDC